MAANVLAGEMAAKAGDMASAERLLRAAVAEQDTHWFTEPPPWYFPVRQSLGAILLQAGRPADAEAVYAKICAATPATAGHSSASSQSLTAQAKTAEARQADAAFRKAWDRKPTSQSPPPASRCWSAERGVWMPSRSDEGAMSE